MNKLVIGELVAKVPIVQGGMGVGISLANLASAVANEGGIGVISAAGIGMFDGKSKDFNYNNVQGLRNEIIKAKKMTSGLLGVNIMVALSNFGELVEAAIEEEIDFIFAGAGLPIDLPKYIRETSKTKLVPIISSGRAAKIIIKKWLKNYNYLPDAFVLEGPLAGGHLGFKKENIELESYKLENLLPEVLEVLAPFEKEYKRKIPVIVGGGIFDGSDIHYYLNNGASAVQMATRFVTTEECDASDVFKQTYIDAKKEDIIYIESPVGLPGRAIRNPYLNDVKNGLKHPFKCPFNCIVTCKKEEAPYCISLALLNAKKGKMDNGFAFAGSNAFRLNEIISVKDLINTLKFEYRKAIKMGTFKNLKKQKVVTALT
ncbi:MAG: nitronate monooxygenase [Tenericutes bacterium]|nr:nitronate monooxygenase [Mycoplasmatota bacterium]